MMFVSGCFKKPAKRDVKENLKYAMEKYLNSPSRMDTSKVKFTVLDVNYYEDRKAYDCEFKVHLKDPGTDTIGMMGATITKDFSQVKRKY
jgi:hypothetical protein